jgi:hypothetical protein
VRGTPQASSSFSNGWTGAVVEVGAKSARFEMNNPAAGIYQGSVRTKELVHFDAEYPNAICSRPPACAGTADRRTWRFYRAKEY